MIVVCPHCATSNRVPDERLKDAPACGRCSQRLFAGAPVTLTQATFDRHLRGELPLVVDFWAGWCAPCRAMAPFFADAAARMEPKVRFGKIDTEAEQALAGRYAIRSIPTVIAFKGGREVARQSGAMMLAELMAWVEQATR